MLSRPGAQLIDLADELVDEPAEPSGERAIDESSRRSSRRATASLRRYCVHNGLSHMPTLTYASPAANVRTLTEDMRNLRRRLTRSCDWFPDDPFPYAWVAEAGSIRGRLHVHLACEWWGRLGCVEVCERCATKKLRAVRSDIPPAGARCIGCVWGRGFVGAPSEGTGDPRKLASYISKYASKAFDEGRLSSQRYRVAEGFQPSSTTFGAGDLVEALRTAAAAIGQVPVVEPLHETVRGWDGPPVWSLRWDPETAVEVS